MAKVMISMPDDLLSRVDRHAVETGQSRSGFLQQLAVAALQEQRRGRQSCARDLLADAKSRGGSSAEDLRLLRDTR